MSGLRRSVSTYPWRAFRTARLKCAGAPSCICHIRVLIASGTSSSSFGRSCKRKSGYWVLVSRCGKTCGHTKQSPTILAHALMLKCCWCLNIILSTITHELNVSGHMLMWTFLLVLVCGTRAESLPAPFSYTLYINIICVTHIAICTYMPK
jgi:hypothetical protein